MSAVTRLVTHVELDESATDARRLSVDARLEAVLEDGRSLVLLDDRGWSSSGPPEALSQIPVEDIELDARTVVGPDEPYDGTTYAQMAADHWNHLARVLQRQGVPVEGRELERLPHDVVLGERLRAWTRDR
ncbi:hypothetical protein EDD29_4760 [Actinocorallia herbida]|uniref:Uncharacterized protein n=1 Tax=Actinocorallia herbida TaxID=58109 RepID=A0A3N1D0V3_9ACTN|nr:hypothetical protein [Actinocorallia herbida]ROO87167.1 hypothetical protein EDD29_4760 [Actinocorallia herbida]